MIESSKSRDQWRHLHWIYFGNIWEIFFYNFTKKATTYLAPLCIHTTMEMTTTPRSISYYIIFPVGGFRASPTGWGRGEPPKSRDQLRHHHKCISIYMLKILLYNVGYKGQHQYFHDKGIKRQPSQCEIITKTKSVDWTMEDMEDVRLSRQNHVIKNVITISTF